MALWQAGMLNNPEYLQECTSEHYGIDFDEGLAEIDSEYQVVVPEISYTRLKCP